jgi:hypothetical protein
VAAKEPQGLASNPIFKVEAMPTSVFTDLPMDLLLPKSAKLRLSSHWNVNREPV